MDLTANYDRYSNFICIKTECMFFTFYHAGVILQKYEILIKLTRHIRCETIHNESLLTD